MIHREISYKMRYDYKKNKKYRIVRIDEEVDKEVVK